MNHKIKLLMMLFFLAAGRGIQAQNIQLIMSPKPSPYISDWQDRTETVKLVITNPGGKDILVKIKTELFDGKQFLIANTDVEKMPVLTIPPGITIYNAEEVFPLSAVQYHGKLETGIITTGRIPDDNYRICIALTDPVSGKVTGSSGTVCKTFSITAYQAPTLILPTKYMVIPETEIKGIVFRWSPVIPSASFQTTYRMQVWEVLEGQTEGIAMRTNQPIVEKDYPGILQAQWPVDFALPEAGKSYVWTITPLDPEGRKVVDGNGFSEPFGFKINERNMSIPMVRDTTYCHGTYLGQTAYGIHFIIDNNTTNNIISWSVNSTQVTLIPSGPVNGAPSAISAGATNIPASNAIMFTNPTGNPIYVQITFNYAGGGSFTTDHAIHIPNCSNTACHCGYWSKVHYEKNGTATVFTNCSNEFTAIATDAFNFGADYHCTPNDCLPNGTYTSIYKPDNTLLTQNPGLNIAFNLAHSVMPCGKYKVVFHSKCGTDSCSNCELYIKIPCNNDCCQGSSWGSRATIANGVSKPLGPCGKDFGTLKCNTTKVFNVCYNCNPDCAGSAQIKYSVFNNLNILQSSITVSSCQNATINIPGLTGDYHITIQAICNGVICNSCIYYFKTRCKLTSCNCGPKKWGADTKIEFTKYAGGNGSLTFLKCFQATTPPIIKSGTSMIYTFPGLFCTPQNCPATYKYKIINLANQIISGPFNATGSPVQFMAPTEGNYKFIIYSYCSGKLCDSCGFNFVTKNQNCCPGRWISKKVSATGEPTTDLICGKNYPVKCNKTYNINAYYTCGNDSVCRGKAKYTMPATTGATLTGAGLFTATANGNYVITIQGKCGDSICEKCEVTFVVDNCNNCCPLSCDSSRNKRFYDQSSWIGISSTLIEFNTDDDGTPISEPNAQIGLTNWTRNEIVFNNCSSYWNSNIIGGVNSPVGIKLPPCKYNQVSFDLSIFNGGRNGYYTIKVYSCQCVYTYTIDGSGNHFFGIQLPTSIDKIEVMHSTDNIVIDNFRFGHN